MAAGCVSKSVVLPGTGEKMPTVAYGTWTVWLAKPNQIYEGVKTALEAGYRHIDCAWVYDNEAEVGQAVAEKIQDGTIKREDIFITTKIWDTYHGRERARLNVQKSLAKLQLTYLDLVLIHWPVAFKDGDDNFPKDADGNIIFAEHDHVDTWRGLEDCVNEGLVRNIGLSNFNSRQIQRVLDAATVKPCNIQIEVNPCFTNDKLIRWARERNIVVSAYAPLGAPSRPWKESTDPTSITDPVVVNMAAKKNKSPAQVILRWHLQRGLCLCVKSVTPDRIRENFDIFDFELTEEEMAQISGLNKNFRLYREGVATSHPDYPFHAEY